MTERTPTVDLDLAGLDVDPYPALSELRARTPVAWIPAMGGWMVTRRDLVVAMMRDPQTFTVDDPRFSTGQVVGPSMLSLDGPEHDRHRQPFANHFRATGVRRALVDAASARAQALVGVMAERGEGEIRTDIAAPLAVGVVAESLGLVDADPMIVRGWYDDIVDAVSRASTGRMVEAARPDSVDDLGRHVRASIDTGVGLVADAVETLSPDEVTSNVAVVLFGGIETVEGSIASAFALLLEDRSRWEELRADPDLTSNAVEESLRSTPSVLQLDRFATRDVDVEGARVRVGDFVMLSIAGANHDPATYPDPEAFDIRRANAKTHVTFARGPHTCLGMHLARLEVAEALRAAMALENLRLVEKPVFEGVVFRKPRSVRVAWDSTTSPQDRRLPTLTSGLRSPTSGRPRATPIVG